MTPAAPHVIERLDAWLADFAKLEDPIETALDDMYGFLDEVKAVAHGECGHARSKCQPCLKGAIDGASEAYDRLREAWDTRA